MLLVLFQDYNLLYHFKIEYMLAKKFAHSSFNCYMSGKTNVHEISGKQKERILQ
jgi:hypothetical protein